MKPLILSSPFDVDELTEGRETLITEMRQILQDAQSDSRELTAQERKAFAAASRDFEKFGDQLKAAQEREDNEAALIKAGRTRKEPRPILGQMMRAVFQGPQGRNSDSYRREFDFTSGNATIQDPRVQAEFFETLKANNPLADLGARFLIGPNYMQFPRQLTDPAVTWFEEGDTAVLPDTAATIDSVKIQYKIPAIVLDASNFWLEDSGPLGAEILSRMGVSALQNAIISAVLNGAAASGQPVGLDNVAGVQTVAAGGALASFAKITEGVKKLLAANVKLENIGGIYSPSVWQQINDLIDQADQPLLMPAGLRDIPMYTSTAVLEDYGTGDDETRIYLGDWANIMIASSGGPMVSILRETKATQFMTQFVVHMRCDVGVIRPNAFCRIEGIPTA